jgi:dihydrofolate reductase
MCAADMRTDGRWKHLPLCDGRIRGGTGAAKKAAGSKDVKIGGGVATVRQYLGAGLIDSLHIVSAPVLLGQGESLFDGLDLHASKSSLAERKASEYATLLVFEKA